MVVFNDKNMLRCNLCKIIKNNTVKYITKQQNHNIHYDICKDCVDKLVKLTTESTNKQDVKLNKSNKR